MELVNCVRKTSLTLRILEGMLVTLLLASCSGNGSKEQQKSKDADADTSSLILKYDNTLFAVPSPYQASTILKKNNIPFNDELSNPANKVQGYNSSFKRGINLGIYGTDLSYYNIYDRSQECVTYFGSVKKLCDELGISSSFDTNFFAKVEKNISIKDSLQYLMSYTYRNADLYLKQDDRSDVGALVLAGGWIESLYILTQIASKTQNRDIINRIGEQKHPLDNLIDILSPHYYVSPEYSKLVDDLVDLAYEFDGIIYNYYYKPPKIDVDNKLITINSESQVVLSGYHLEVITNKIAAIRNKAVQ
ncbi:MAG TPA: hypothetical protein VMW01_14540 [Williamwhitmania sp.]|nr:hypothetical protein [Williamwhitmania sp.]